MNFKLRTNTGIYMLKKISVCLLFSILILSGCRNQADDKEIKMPDGFQGVHLGMEKDAFLKIRPKADVHPMDTGRDDLMDPNIDLHELVKNDSVYGLNMVGMYVFDNNILKKIIIIWGDDLKQVKKSENNFINANIKRWGRDYRPGTMGQHQHQKDKSLTTAMLWQKNDSIIITSVSYGFGKGAYGFVLTSKNDKEILKNFIPLKQSGAKE